MICIEFIGPHKKSTVIDLMVQTRQNLFPIATENPSVQLDCVKPWSAFFPSLPSQKHRIKSRTVRKLTFNENDTVTSDIHIIPNNGWNSSHHYHCTTITNRKERTLNAIAGVKVTIVTSIHTRESALEGPSNSKIIN